MKNFKKIIIASLVVLLLIGCGKKNEIAEIEDSSYYLEQLKNYKVKEKDKSKTKDNEEFDEFLDNFFIDSISESYLYLHNNVSDYHKLNINKPEVTLGEVTYSDEADSAEYIEKLENLKKFDFDSLSYRQQYDYDLLEYSLLETIVSAFYEKYDLLFSRGTNVLDGLIVELNEFVLYDKESIDDYIVLIKDVDRYLDDCLIYTKAQADIGLYLSDTSIDFNASFVDNFVSNVDDNSLIVSFNNRLKTIDFISDELKTSYINENTKIIKNEVIPAFNKVKEELLTYKGKGTNSDLALCNIDKNYAEISFMINTSLNMPIEEIFKMTEEVLDDMTALFNTACYDDDAVEEFTMINNSKKYGGFGLEDIDTLKYLEEHLKEKYIELLNPSYEVSRLDASSANNDTVAYYVSPPLDNLDLNIIRTNPNAMGSDIVYDYMVLAHEGFPGHLYQNIYFQRTNPNRFRETQDFIGYTEGYATYVQSDALDFSGIKNPNTANIYRYFYISEYLIDSIVDIGVNYYGWSIKDVRRYLKQEGFNEDAAESLYETSIDRSGILDRYGVGYAKFITMKEKAKDKLGDKYKDVEFNELLIKNGPLPFCILEDAIDEYIREKVNN